MKNNILYNFCPHLHVKILDLERVVLFSEEQHYLLRGEIYVAISKILEKNGSISEQAAINILQGFLPQFIELSFKKLREKGFIILYENSPKNVSSF